MAYAGIAPVTRQSGTSIHGEHPSRGGNKQLKNALFQSAFAAIRPDTESRAHYERKREQGKRHNAAVMCLARRRCNVLSCMLKNGTLYEPKAQRQAAPPARPPSPAAPRNDPQPGKGHPQPPGTGTGKRHAEPPNRLDNYIGTPRPHPTAGGRRRYSISAPRARSLPRKSA